MGESPYRESGLMSDTQMKQAPSAIWRGLFRFVGQDGQDDGYVRLIPRISLQKLEIFLQQFEG
jgi:hypothetical protein